jgi:PKD repeat protein
MNMFTQTSNRYLLKYLNAFIFLFAAHGSFAQMPVADFAISKTELYYLEQSPPFQNLSANATSWKWYLTPTTYDVSRPFINTFSPSATAENPNLWALEPGSYGVCLVATNSTGSDTLCKPNLLTIYKSYEPCKGTLLMSDTFATDHQAGLRLYTVAGSYVPALIGGCNKGFTISCPGDTLTLYVDMFKMRSIDSVRIKSVSKTGSVIARFGGMTAPDSIKIPGGIAYIETALGNNTGAGDSGYVMHWKDSTAAALPVTLRSFSGKTVANDVALAWSTVSENNNMGFAIERATVKDQWTEAGFVKGHNNSSSQQQYSFIDISPFVNDQPLYYRLKQVDFDGKTSYSHTITVNRNPAQKVSINISPNPFEGISVLTVQSPAAISGTIRIIDMSGKQLMTKEILLSKGTNTIQLTETRALKPGTYLLQLTIENDIQTFRFVKK